MVFWMGVCVYVRALSIHICSEQTGETVRATLIVRNGQPARQLAINPSSPRSGASSSACRDGRAPCALKDANPSFSVLSRTLRTLNLLLDQEKKPLGSLSLVVCSEEFPSSTRHELEDPRGRRACSFSGNVSRVSSAWCLTPARPAPPPSAVGGGNMASACHVRHAVMSGDHRTATRLTCRTTERHSRPLTSYSGGPARYQEQLTS